MSDNPFASVPNEPVHQAAAVAVPPKPPGALTLILVCCLILGILGLSGSCFSAVGLALQSTLEEFAVEGAVSGAQRELQKISMAAAKKGMVFGIALAGVNLIVGSLLIIGSIGGLQRKESGRKLLRIGILAAMFYSFLKIGFYIFNQIISAAAIQAGIEAMKEEPIYDEMQQFASITTVIGWVSVAVFVVMSLILLGFYIWARFYLNKDQVVQYFATQNVKAV